jgi:hypothetical protein
VTREHGDVDVALFCEDQDALRQHLSGWTLRKVKHGPLSDWREDESLRLPVHEVHATRSGLRLELLLNEREGETWLYRRDARVRLPVERLILRAEPGLQGAPVVGDAKFWRMWTCPMGLILPDLVRRLNPQTARQETPACC